MHDLYNLKDMLVKELEDFGKSGSLSKTSLDTIDKLAHATKNIAKVIECCETDEYSRSMGRSYTYDRSYGDRYSYSDDGLKGQLYRLMDTATDERTRNEVRKLIDKL